MSTYMDMVMDMDMDVDLGVRSDSHASRGGGLGHAGSATNRRRSTGLPAVRAVSKCFSTCRKSARRHQPTLAELRSAPWTETYGGRLHALAARAAAHRDRRE